MFAAENCGNSMSEKLYLYRRRSTRNSAVCSMDAILGNRGRQANARLTAVHAQPKNTDQSEEAVSSLIDIPPLNDDCLLEIFSYLDTLDLCTVKYCSLRFSGLADSVVQKRFREENYVTLPGPESNFVEASRIIETFGRFLNRLHIENCTSFLQFKGGSGFISMMQKCNLKSLELRGVDTWNVPVEAFKQVNRNIKMLDPKIKMYKFEITPMIVEILKVAKMLKHLTIEKMTTSIQNQSKILSVIIMDHANLETLRLKMFPSGMNLLSSAHLVQYVQHLRKLKKLKDLELGYSKIHSIFGFIRPFSQIIDEMKKLGRHLNEFTSLEKFTLHIDDDMSDAITSTANNFVGTVGADNDHPFFTINLLRKNL